MTARRDEDVEQGGLTGGRLKLCRHMLGSWREPSISCSWLNDDITDKKPGYKDIYRSGGKKNLFFGCNVVEGVGLHEQQSQDETVYRRGRERVKPVSPLQILPPLLCKGNHQPQAPAPYPGHQALTLALLCWTSKLVSTSICWEFCCFFSYINS